MNVRPSEMQLQLFFLLASLIVRYRPEGIVRLTDADVTDAAGAMATTLEAADRGIIAEVPGASPIGESLRRQLDGLLAELGKQAGSGFAREAAMVLRGIERGARHDSPGIDSSESGYLDVLRRVLPPPSEERPERPPSPILMP
jgi:hypothetical protein